MQDSEQIIEFRKGVFVITEENNCPLYNVGEELGVEQNWVNMPSMKSTCLILAQDLAKLTSEDTLYEQQGIGEAKKTKFECSGCVGVIRFEYKKEKEYSTIQMKLLAAAERKERIESASVVASQLTGIELFKPLSSDDLADLITLLEVKDFAYGFPICQRGEPGTHLYIILNGKVEVLDDDGIVLSEMSRGEVFGEMSLLSGDRVSTTIIAVEPCEIATLNQKNFNHILNKFPALQVFLYKLVVRRITEMNSKRAEELASGMTGQVADIPIVELCQMINANHKTGRLKVDTDKHSCAIVFNEGEIIHAEVADQRGVEAFFEILSFNTGRFQFSQGLTSREKKLDVIGGFMGLLMEGMKRQDEEENRHTRILR